MEKKEFLEKPEPYPPENMVQDLQEIITQIQTGTFSGVLVYSNYNKQKAWAQMVGGAAQDRLILVDAALASMIAEPIQESRDWFLTQIYERFKLLRPDSLAEADRAIV